MIMPWGKHKGRRLSEIPGSYLFWLLEECDSLRDDLRIKIQEELRNRIHPKQKTGIDVASIRDWCRRASLVCHPDTGGSVAAMKLVNELRQLVSS
jgi:hypothetical protein